MNSTRFLYVRYDADTASLQDEFRRRVESLEAGLNATMVPVSVPGHLTEAEYQRLIERMGEYRKDALRALETFYMNVGKVLRDRQLIRGTAEEVKERG